MGNTDLIPTYNSSMSNLEYERFCRTQLLAARQLDHQKLRLG